MRGFAGIGLCRPKNTDNVGGVLRAAHCYGAAYIAIENERCHVHDALDTTRAYRHLPVLRGDDLAKLIPYGVVPIAIDLVPEATSLPLFIHPESAFYIFGPEDGTLGARELSWCKYRVAVPTQYCMNLAATVNVVLYDRKAKQDVAEREKNVIISRRLLGQQVRAELTGPLAAG